MKILMVTNTYLPFIGGVERSIEIFATEYRNQGHQVLIVAPRINHSENNEPDVIRVPAIQNFNGTDFSVQLPVPGLLNKALKKFQPDIVHSHHPFMLGDTALRIAAQYKIPIVYTFHTYYEYYTHYVPGNCSALKRFVIALSTGYANLCDHIIAPSSSVAIELKDRGVETCIDVIPTGIDVQKYLSGNGKELRAEMGIPKNAFVIGFVSRLAPEKNLSFLTDCVIQFMGKHKNTCFLMIGCGPLEAEVKQKFALCGLKNRFYPTGILVTEKLLNAYNAMNVFAFASKTETQGLVLTEAIASGVPVVALDGPCIGEVIENRINGRLINTQNKDEFCKALSWVKKLSKRELKIIKENNRARAKEFSKRESTSKLLDIYNNLLSKNYIARDHADSGWDKAKRLIKAELDLIKNLTRATGAAINDSTE